MPSPLLLPYLSPDPWKRRLHDVVAEMSTLAALLFGILGLGLSALLDLYIDRVFRYDVVHTAIYMLPVGFVAWACGVRLGMATALIASLAELLVATMSIKVRPPGAIGFSFSSSVVILFTLSSLMANLRYLLEEERNLSRTDPLTGIANQRAFWKAMDLEVERMKRDGKPLTVLFADIDNFKQVNDSYGHKGGDRVLSDFSKALTEATRAVDTVARIGGDEFAALLPGADADAGLAVAGRLRASFKSTVSTPTLSIGLATFRTPPDTTEALLRASDILMYEAKSAGKNTAVSRVY